MNTGVQEFCFQLYSKLTSSTFAYGYNDYEYNCFGISVFNENYGSGASIGWFTPSILFFPDQDIVELRYYEKDSHTVNHIYRYKLELISHDKKNL